MKEYIKKIEVEHLNIDFSLSKTNVLLVLYKKGLINETEFILLKKEFLKYDLQVSQTTQYFSSFNKKIKGDDLNESIDKVENLLLYIP
ncbi:hypothetical protein GLW08_12720 [Pontibacillus yanchengensis]|uniref:Uncharacterized protein n=1 Tax=Pontibacillus yanchengensis TaxID=462910 RepID=A0ACC7VHN0_9BACI|nr:hypothetical protein [Pontibacillus yanchengensis]MYL54200.1 hypothetical protein [Pontibacillus yanchengensis]